jgi:hypothetical protein
VCLREKREQRKAKGKGEESGIISVWVLKTAAKKTKRKKEKKRA